jgi:hypothetical protein
MSARDPFLRSILVVVDRIAVYLVLTGLAFVLLWEQVCKRALRAGYEDALRFLIVVVRGDPPPVLMCLLMLTLTVAALSVGVVCYALFSLWSRRARVQVGYVRGPHLEGAP